MRRADNRLADSFRRIWDAGRSDFEPDNPWMNWCIPLSMLAVSLMLVLIGIPLLPWP